MRASSHGDAGMGCGVLPGFLWLPSVDGWDEESQGSACGRWRPGEPNLAVLKFAGFEILLPGTCWDLPLYFKPAWKQQGTVRHKASSLRGDE